MTSYFDKRRKQKLYQQWVKESGLPPESVPADSEQKSDRGEPVDDDTGMRRPGILTDVTFRLTIRHILYLLLIIAVLLIATATLTTVLIMRSC